jgi:hypothetical protein
MREIETQSICGDQRAFLLHMLAEHFSQRCVQQVRRGVIERDGRAALGIDLRLDFIADSKLAGLEHADVRERRADLLRVAHREACGASLRRASAEDAGIADLTAAFRVERRMVEHHLPFLAGCSAIDHGAVENQAR